MCRFIAYLGKPILMEDVLYKPKNSLIKQSVRARETDEPLNGDGFGIGWYNHDIDFTPGVFRSIQPAWSDRNLMHVSAKIRSSCFFAHVRAASNGDVAQTNCHPFYYKHLLFMHNGDIGGFSTIKRYMRRELNDDIYNWIKGQTDSEHFFAVFLNKLVSCSKEVTVDVMADLLRATIQQIEELKKAHNITETTYISAALTDGLSMVGVRYVSNSQEVAPSLHYAAGANYTCDKNGVCHMLKGESDENEAILITSEKLSNYNADWKEVPTNNLVLVDKYMNVKLQAI